MKQQYTERSVYWGISDDDKLRGKAQVLYSENLDLTTNSDYYTVSQEAKYDWITDIHTSDEIINIFEANWQIFYCDKDKNLYRAWNSTPVWTDERIEWTWVTSTYLYMIDASKYIYRILLSNLSQADWSTYITTTDTTITTNWEVFVTSDEDTAYVWIWNKVYEVANSTWVVVWANTFTIDSDVSGLSKLEDSIQIFTESWKYIIRDWVAWGSVRTKDLWVKIGYVQNIWSDNYIVTWWAVYILNWYRLEQITANPYSDTLDSLKYSIENMRPWKTTYLEWVFYTGVDWTVSWLSTPWDEFEFWDAAVMTYWIKKKRFPLAINLWISRIEGIRIKEIHQVYAYTQTRDSTGKKLYIWYEDVNWLFWVATLSLSDQSWDFVSGDWILIYNTFDWGLKEAQKDLLRVKIRADIFWEDDTLSLCTLNNDWELEWFNWTEANSTVWLSDLWEDWYYYFEPSNSLQFYNFTPALILHNDDNVSRRNWIRVYSLTYEYDFTRQR